MRSIYFSGPNVVMVTNDRREPSICQDGFFWGLVGWLLESLCVELLFGAGRVDGCFFRLVYLYCENVLDFGWHCFKPFSA